MPNAEHSKAIWPELSSSGIVLDAAPAYLRYDGADVVFSLVGPGQLVFSAVEGGDGYTLVDLTPVYIAAGGDDYKIDTVGPAVAILVDDGAGGFTLSTDLTQTPVADLAYDTAGDLWIVRRTADRLDAVAINGDFQLY